MTDQDKIPVLTDIVGVSKGSSDYAGKDRRKLNRRAPIIEGADKSTFDIGLDDDKTILLTEEDQALSTMDITAFKAIIETTIKRQIEISGMQLEETLLEQINELIDKQFAKK